jgi:cystathionine beta-lyase|tara:strand:+ start:8580 stop:9746 length:1167 start_codon:yes stop_codon:yes gene_type:complete
MHPSTKLLHYGRSASLGTANPPIVKASTILHDTVAAYKDNKSRRENDDSVLSYGRRGTTTAHELAAAIKDLESGDGCFLFPTGIAAIAGAISAYVSAGDHLLVVDTIFPATRTYCEKQLVRNNIEIDYFPWDTTDISSYLKPNTKAIMIESPASQTYEVMDLPALCKSAHKHDLIVIADNTYGSSWLYRPLELGCDVSVIAGTKYLGGHADVMMGAAVVKEHALLPLRSFVHMTGQTLAPDEAYACLRGMRTLDLRLQRHGENSSAIAKWLLNREEVKFVLHPNLPNHKGYEIWKRDATGCNGLLSVAFHQDIDVEKLLDNLRLFSIGTSWGGFESLALPIDPQSGRIFKSEFTTTNMVRFHIGIEHIDDIVADFSSAFSLLSDNYLK